LRAEFVYIEKNRYNSIVYEGATMTNQRCCAAPNTPTALPTTTSVIVDQLKAIAHPVRWRMLELMAMQDDGICVCDLESQFDLSQPTISHHLRIMREAGVVGTDQRGTWVYYSVRPETISQLTSVFAQLVSVKA
jgi:ArsR family transcriptional regulator, arsenate/arsenite/antimonite-responsive transcriptional repressor